MRILVANDIDSHQFQRADSRGWCERVFWFASPGDLVIVPEEPNADFMESVARIRDIDRASWEVVVAPSGRFGSRMIDFSVMGNEKFLQDLRLRLHDRVTEVVTLFPTSDVLPLAQALGDATWVPAGDFLREGGATLCNSKATFRLIALGAGAATPEGAVCFTQEQLTHAIRCRLERREDVVVKRVHAGGGAGNELVSLGGTLPSNVGIRSHQILSDSARESVARYVSERWDWASQSGRDPVVLETMIDAVESFSVEYVLQESGAEFIGASTLGYSDNRIERESMGRVPLSPDLLQDFYAASASLARQYLALGFRGFICFDAVVDGRGSYFFTEANARTATGTHLNVVFGDLLTRRLVTQLRSRTDWGPLTARRFLSVVDDLGVAFDRQTECGVLMSFPPTTEHLDAGFYFVVITSNQDQEAALLERLESGLRR